MSEINANFKEIIHRMDEAKKRSGRDSDRVTLVTVTKTVDIARIKEAINSGAKILGENRVQEIMEKYDELSPYAEFHLIGHLQKNKAKYIVGKVSLIHSVESLELAGEIDKRAKQSGVIQRILIEVNVSGEESKFGIMPEEVISFVEEVSKLQNVKIEGLMTVAPFDAEVEELRGIFKKLKNLSLEVKNCGFDNVSMDELSMGMTGDFEIAIEEGATMVRVGTGIFGKRNYV